MLPVTALSGQPRPFPDSRRTVPSPASAEMLDHERLPAPYMDPTWALASPGAAQLASAVAARVPREWTTGV
ncbi:hypothetical protein GCM10023329_50670 [Streptomyces sanyensis]|uniref:Uncharacterized protein n=1 Tax=Streptomyces sanyensis TaxID=568869 RepID=A0ABP9B9J5_9ACTN